MQTLAADGSITMSAEPVTLTLVRGCAWFDEAKLAKLFPDAQMRDDVQNYVHCCDHAALRALPKLSFMLNYQQVELVAGTHYFCSSGDASRAK